MIYKIPSLLIPGRGKQYCEWRRSQVWPRRRFCKPGDRGSNPLGASTVLLFRRLLTFPSSHRSFLRDLFSSLRRQVLGASATARSTKYLPGCLCFFNFADCNMGYIYRTSHHVARSFLSLGAGRHYDAFSKTDTLCSNAPNLASVPSVWLHIFSSNSSCESNRSSTLSNRSLNRSFSLANSALVSSSIVFGLPHYETS